MEIKNKILGLPWVASVMLSQVQVTWLNKPRKTNSLLSWATFFNGWTLSKP